MQQQTNTSPGCCKTPDCRGSLFECLTAQKKQNHTVVMCTPDPGMVSLSQSPAPEATPASKSHMKSQRHIHIRTCTHMHILRLSPDRHALCTRLTAFCLIQQSDGWAGKTKHGSEVRVVARRGGHGVCHEEDKVLRGSPLAYHLSSSLCLTPPYTKSLPSMPTATLNTHMRRYAGSLGFHPVHALRLLARTITSVGASSLTATRKYFVLNGALPLMRLHAQGRTAAEDRVVCRPVVVLAEVSPLGDSPWSQTVEGAKRSRT